VEDGSDVRVVDPSFNSNGPYNVLHHDGVGADGGGGGDEGLPVTLKCYVISVPSVVVNCNVTVARVSIDKDETGVVQLRDGVDLPKIEVVEDVVDDGGGVDRLDVSRYGAERVNEVGELGGACEGFLVSQSIEKWGE
jgi:hypothetical protein